MAINMLDGSALRSDGFEFGPTLSTGMMTPRRDEKKAANDRRARRNFANPNGTLHDGSSRWILNEFASSILRSIPFSRVFRATNLLADSRFMAESSLGDSRGLIRKRNRRIESKYRAL